MDKTVNSTPSVTSNLYAFLVKKCELLGVSLNSTIKKAGVSHQIVSSWKKNDPKTLTLIHKVLTQISLLAEEKRQEYQREKTLYAGSYIKTASGIYVDVFNPTPDMFCIEDIAIGLSRKYRWGGHQNAPFPITVAEHSIKVAEHVDPEYKLQALLHDASEAYISDIPSPIKKQEAFAFYREIEDRIMNCIALKFGFEWPEHEQVKAADRFELHREKEAHVDGMFNAETPAVAAHNFINAFYSIAA